MSLLLLMWGGLFSVFAQRECRQCGGGVSGPKWTLHQIMRVEGRQGVATDGDNYYVSGSTALYKYDGAGRLLLTADKPFSALELPANHIGDIDYHDGELYAGIETFIDGVGKNIQVAVYDAATLEYKRSIPWNPESGQVEVCGIAVDAPHGRVWMGDWVQGTHLYCYSLETGEYVGKVALKPAPKLQQGILYRDGNIIISCDDGDAEKDQCDNLYLARIYSGDSSKLPFQAAVSLYRKMDDFKRVGEIEGLTVNPKTGDLIVLANRGARIILGMPKGFYPGYDAEIHELYFYRAGK